MRTIGLCVRLSPAEHARLIERARLSGRSLLSFVRKAALDRRMPKLPVPAVNLATMGQLNRIGNNLNQAVHLVHMGALSSDFAVALSELDALLRSVKRQLIGLPEQDDED